MVELRIETKYITSYFTPFKNKYKYMIYNI